MSTDIQTDHTTTDTLVGSNQDSEANSDATRGLHALSTLAMKFAVDRAVDAVAAPEEVRTDTIEVTSFGAQPNLKQNAKRIPLPLPGQGRPEGDDRSAKEIMEDSPMLRNLSDEGKAMLSKWVGDIETDADAAWRATQVLAYIDNTASDGSLVQVRLNNDNRPDSDYINGFDDDGTAEISDADDSEAQRLINFGENGYDSLKGIDDQTLDESFAQVYSDTLRETVEAEGGDKSKVDAAYYEGGTTDATGADKAATLLALIDGLAEYKSVQKEHAYKINPKSAEATREQFYKDTEAKIAMLEADPEVQAFQRDQVIPALQDKVANDPALKKEYQRRFEHFSSTDALVYAFDTKNADGSERSALEAVVAFQNQADAYAQALGVSTEQIYTRALADAPKEIRDQVNQAYRDVTLGLTIQEDLKDGKRLNDALSQAVSAKAILERMVASPERALGNEDFDGVLQRLPDSAHETLASNKSLLRLHGDRTQELLSAQGLSAALKAVDSQGQPLHTQNAIQNYLANVDMNAQAAGWSQESTDKRLQSTFASLPSEVRERVLAAYNDVVSGQRLLDEIKNGMPLEEAVARSGQEKLALERLVGPEQAAKGSETYAKMQDSIHEQIRDVVKQDPELRKKLQAEYDQMIDSEQLELALQQRGPDGEPVSTADAVSAYVAKVQLYGEAVGATPEEDLRIALAGAPQSVRQEISQTYADICTGREMEALIAGGMSAEEAVATSSNHRDLFNLIVTGPDRKMHGEKFEEARLKVMRENLIEEGSMEAVYKGLGVTGIDDPRLEQVIEENIQAVTPPGTDTAPLTQDVLRALRGVDDMVRGGGKFSEAVRKLQDGKIPSALGQVYNTGVLHVASGAILAGLIGVNHADTARTVGQSFQVAGLLTEGGAKAYAQTLTGAYNSSDEAKQLAAWLTNQMKGLEAAGKFFAGMVGNTIGAVVNGMDAASAFKSGDYLAGSFSAAFAAINTAAAITSTVEVGSFVASRLVASEAAAAGLSTVSTQAAAWAGRLGWVGAALSIVAVIVFGDTSSEQSRREDAYANVKDDFAALDIDIPDYWETFGDGSGVPASQMRDTEEA